VIFVAHDHHGTLVPKPLIDAFAARYFAPRR
jgi:hypothetical protein